MIESHSQFSPMTIPQLGAFYQCYGQPKSLLRALGSFRYYYPKGTIMLISDGGMDFKRAADCFRCEYERQSRLSSGTGTYFSTPEELGKWIERLLAAARKMKEEEEYFIILEDDVLILKPVTDLRYDLNGINEYVFLGEELTEFLKKNNSTINTPDSNYGGGGGSILRRRFVMDHFDKISDAVHIIKKYARQDPKGLPRDYYLSALVLYYGGSIGPYRGHWETGFPNYRDRLCAHDIEVLHQEKSLFNQPLETWEAALLGLPVNW